MSLLKKTVSFLAVMACAPAAFAVTARPAIVTQAASRMPTLTAALRGTTSTTTTTTSSSASLYDNAECIDAYNACIKGGDACGSDFEECTTKVLFHAQMPKCLSTLAQCSTSGINALFGTTATTALSTVASTNSYGEVTDYTYPTDGSVLGQMITAAAISNKYDTGNCIRRYTQCLNKDNVCGSDFELCTTNSEFRKQMVACESTLARCQSDGKIELFGSTTTTAAPTASSRIGEMITEGAALAAINAVSTCYKVVDQCILNACAANPFNCVEGSNSTIVTLADNINTGTSVADFSAILQNISDTLTGRQISAYIRNSCLDTIGSNKYCYATFIGDGQMPTASQLRDEDNHEEIYDAAYSSRMNASMRAKITDLVNKFDTRAKEKCTETIKSCAMRTCGGGSGAACYSLVFDSGDKSVNKSSTRNEIKTGCESVVNTDTNCQYAATNPNTVGSYTYSYMNSDAFDILFPEYEEGGNDPIGVVANLNAALATTYNDAAIAQMKKQCQSVATSCVKSLCGTDYVNCYRNRTDMYSDLTNTGNATFDKSMNKVGGVLDYTVVLGLCLDTVKNASVCEEHLAIESAKIKMGSSKTSSWGDATSVRGGWIDAGSATSLTEDTEVVEATDENGNKLCTTAGNNGTLQNVCGYVDASGNVYDVPVTISYTTYVQSQAAETLFKDLIYDIEKEAQAKYNAKLTREQNMCMSSNNGGIMGNRETGSTYMWVKLKNNKVPTGYAVSGLSPTQFVASNDLYGSFCRMRVTVQSDIKEIQDMIGSGKGWATAYFAVGDAFTCGSWISNEDLEEIAKPVACKNAGGEWGGGKCTTNDNQKKTRGWITALTAAGSFVGGTYLTDAIVDGKAFGALSGLGDNNKKDEKALVQECTVAANAAKTYIRYDENKDKKLVETYLDSMYSAMDGLKLTYLYVNDKVDLSDWDAKVNAYKAAKTDNQKKQEAEKAAEKAEKAIDELAKQCTQHETLANSAQDEKKSNLNWINPIGGAVTALGTGLLVNKATKDIQESKLSTAEKEAYEEWMNDVGNHIKCFIGGDEVGTYGDVITTAVE